MLSLKASPPQAWTSGSLARWMLPVSVPRYWAAAAFAACAAFAGGVALFSTNDLHRLWGLIATGAYIAAALAVLAWRSRGIDLALVLSVALTVLVGTALLNGPGFSASWSDPALEGVLAGITLAAAAVAVLRGGFSRQPLSVPPPEPGSGEGGGWELIRQREALARQERRLQHALRTSRDPKEIERLTAELDGLRSEVARLAQAREAEYA